MGLLDPKFRYVPSKHMGPDYLKKKFARLRRDQEKAAAKPRATVRTMQRRSA